MFIYICRQTDAHKRSLCTLLFALLYFDFIADLILCYSFAIPSLVRAVELLNSVDLNSKIKCHQYAQLEQISNDQIRRKVLDSC